MSIETLPPGLHYPRQATIQLSDTFGPLGLQLETVPPPEDFDAGLTAQVRNTGRFVDAQFALSDGGTMLGNYGAVLLEDLHAQQQEQAHQILEALGAGSPDELTPDQLAGVHPDSQVRLQTLGESLVAVINSAPRTAEHQKTGQNGNDFYLALTESGVEIYAQAHMLSSLDARGLVKSLFRIPNGLVWDENEQFRSSVVSDARRMPHVLEPVARGDQWPIPKLPDGVRVAYTDKFANVRLETSDVGKHREVLATSETVDLVLSDGQVCLRGIRVVRNLFGIEEGEFGVYFNVADPKATDGPAYLELARRVSECNGNSEPRAYHVLRERVGRLLDREISLADWPDITFDIVPSSPQPEAATAWGGTIAS